MTISKIQIESDIRAQAHSLSNSDGIDHKQAAVVRLKSAKNISKYMEVILEYSFHTKPVKPKKVANSLHDKCVMTARHMLYEWVIPITRKI